MGDGPCVHGVTFMRDCLRCTGRFTDRYISLDAAVAAIIERYCDTSRGILCSDFRYAADFLLDEFGSAPSEETREQ